MFGYLKQHEICHEALDRIVRFRHSYLFVAGILTMEIESDRNIKRY